MRLTASVTWHGQSVSEDRPSCRCIQHRLQPVYQVGRMPTSTLLMLSLPLHESLVISKLIISLTFVHNKEVLVLVLRSQVIPAWYVALQATYHAGGREWWDSSRVQEDRTIGIWKTLVAYLLAVDIGVYSGDWQEIRRRVWSPCILLQRFNTAH